MADPDDRTDATLDDDSDEFEALLRDAAHVTDAPLEQASDDGLEPGTAVTDRVRLLRPLGRGGMGSVWVAEHTTLDKRVAVKFVNAAHDAGMVKRFSREAKLCAKIDSPHAVRLFDHGVMDDGTPFIVMELLEGESLAERLARSGVLSIEETRLLVSQVAQVLSEAHALGIIHRDIKPANVFLTKAAYDMFVKVLDFGIAKPAEQAEPGPLTATGTVVGTPQYMAPEQLMDGDVEPRSDLWALATMVYESLTGRLPFTGKTVAALGAAVSRGRFESVSSLRPQLGDDIDAWFERALCVKPDERFASAEELACAFVDTTAALADSPITAPGDATPPSSERARPPHEDQDDEVDRGAATVEDKGQSSAVTARTLAGSEITPKSSKSERSGLRRSAPWLAALAAAAIALAVASGRSDAPESAAVDAASDGDTAATATTTNVGSTAAAGTVASRPEPTAATRDHPPAGEVTASHRASPPAGAVPGPRHTAAPRPTTSPSAAPEVSVPPAANSAPPPPTAATAAPTTSATTAPKKGGIIDNVPF